MFTKAIVLEPCPKMSEGLSTANMGLPDFHLALRQHNAYIEALRGLGVIVEKLPFNNDYPDSVFIEDVALCTAHCAIITRPGALSRRGEVEGMKNVLGKYFKSIEEIRDPGTLEAGDVMMVKNHYFIGLSDRTNQAGADQLIALLEKYGLSGSIISLQDFLHLKSGLAYLENDNLLISGEFIEHPAFAAFHKIIVPENEALAANSLWINGTVLLPSGNPITKEKIEQAGYATIALEISEFQKLDGGLSCLSLRF